MKKSFLVVCLSTQFVFATGIPVVDVLANSQSMAQNIKEIAEWAEQAERWAKTATHYQSQLDAYAAQLASQTGVRNSVSFSKEAKDFYSESKTNDSNFIGLYDALSSPNSYTSSRAQALTSKYTLFDRCEQNSLLSTQEKNLCKSKMASQVDDVVKYEEFAENMNVTSSNIKNLSDKLKNSKDIKESQDINNAIQIEISNLKMQQMQIDLYNKSRERNAQIQEEQKQQLYKQRFYNKVNTNFLRSN